MCLGGLGCLWCVHGPDLNSQIVCLVRQATKPDDITIVFVLDPSLVLIVQMHHRLSRNPGETVGAIRRIIT